MKQSFAHVLVRIIPSFTTAGSSNPSSADFFSLKLVRWALPDIKVSLRFSLSRPVVEIVNEHVLDRERIGYAVVEASLKFCLYF